MDNRTSTHDQDKMSTFEIKRATRQGVKPLIGVYGESGCGKTYSALLLARGIVGPDGKIVLADSESGRGSLYADVLPGGYDTLDLSAPFSPERYIEAIDAVEKSGADIGCLDSTSHEWEGIGGVLDMAGENEQRSGKPGLHCWRAPKLSHAKFVLRLMQSSIPWIVCLRAKYKSRQVKNERGKTEIVKDDHTSPIQAEDFIFELMAHFEVLPDHTIHLTKHSHPALKDCFPEDFKQPVTIQTGEAIAAWCKGGGAKSKPQPGAKPPGTDADRQKAKGTLWKALKAKYSDWEEKFPEESRENAIQETLWQDFYLLEGETLATCTPERLLKIADKITNE